MPKSVNHKARKHALLSASGASRWLNCTPSARLEDKFQESTSSVYAEEGTLAHEFADLLLQRFKHDITQSVCQKEAKKLQKHELYTEEMPEQVAKYRDYVAEQFNASKREGLNPELHIEEKLDFSHIVPEGFGTGDATLVDQSTLEIIDLKYGKGVQVDATENPQLMLYGLGALKKFHETHTIKTVRLTIVQPRLDHFSSWEVSAEKLTEWGWTKVREQAQKAYAGKGEKVAGDWCKWCKVKAMCPALAEKNMELAQHDFAEPELLSDEDLLAIYKQTPMLVDWANAVSNHILEEAKNGKDWPGLKLVEGRSVRKWKDEGKVREVLENDLFAEDDFIQKKLAGIPAVEKLLGREAFQKLLLPYVIKPEGKPTLADENDKRPGLGVEQARQDFSDL